MCQVYRYVLILVNSIYIHTIVLLLAVSQVLYGCVCFSTRSFRVVSTWNLTVLSQVLLVLSQFILIMNGFVLISSNDNCACTLLLLYPYIQILLIVVSLWCLGKEISISTHYPPPNLPRLWRLAFRCRDQAMPTCRYPQIWTWQFFSNRKWHPLQQLQLSDHNGVESPARISVKSWV